MADTSGDGFEDESFNFASFFSCDNPPKMLCFGDNGKECDSKMSESSAKSEVTCSDCRIRSKPKKRNGFGSGCGGPVFFSGGGEGGVAAGSKKCCKKTRSENSTVSGHAKEKKEKIGERITALQQLVSPFGKTDTASVLHEAMGYIRFLQGRVQVLCSPYMHSLLEDKKTKGESETETRINDLRSKGLCLVPVDLTLHVADSNGADFWSTSANTMMKE